MSALTSTASASEREKASRLPDEEVHKAWHRLLGDDCRKEGCALRKERS